MRCRSTGYPNINSFFSCRDLQSLLGVQLKHKIPAAREDNNVQYDADGDVIMRDAPGADPDANSTIPLLDQWCPRR